MFRRFHPGLLALAVLMPAPGALAQEVAPPVALCETCHGADGVSTTAGVPSLAGQNEPYLLESLKELQGGHSSSPLMQGILRDRGEDELQALARHFATRPYVRRAQGEAEAARAARGRETYDRLCQICHRDEGRATSYGEYPLLAGQDLAYMLRGMTTILAGQRRVDAIKRDMLSLVGRDQIDDAIHFFASRTVAPDEVSTALNATKDRRSRRNRFRTGQ